MTPSIISLPSTSTLVEDADEEIFLLYTRKLQTSPTSTSSSSTKSYGLGFLQTNAEVLPISFTIMGKYRSTTTLVGKKKKKENEKGKTKEIKIEMEVWQDLDGLRNRKGDTGSVLWRISLHLAQFFLQQHYFPSPITPSLFPNLSKLTILELGSGTGFLGILLLTILESKSNWIFSDLLESLPLVVKNLKKNTEFINSNRSNTITEGKKSRTTVVVEEEEYSIRELNWLHESESFLSWPSISTSTTFPNLILAVDCIYNPSISLPLLHTICRNAGPDTVVLVASELRDEEPLEIFLRGWLEIEDGAWRIERVGFEQNEEEAEEAGYTWAIGAKDFVVWVGWRK